MSARALIRFLLTLCVLLLLSSKTHATEAKISYCNAASVPRAMDDIGQCQWVTRSQKAYSGLLQPVKWVRIEFNQPLKAQDIQSLAIKIAPHFIPKVTLFKTPDNGSTWDSIAAGSLVPEEKDRSIVGGYLFVVNPTKTGSTYYLKFELFPGLQESLSIEPWPSTGLNSQTGLGIHLGILAVLLVYSIFCFTQEKTLLTGLFFLYLSSVMLTLLAGSGVLADYVLPSFTGVELMTFSTLYCFRLALWTWLSQTFLKNYQTPRWYTGVCTSTYFIAGACLLLTLVNHAAWVMSLIVLGTFLITVSQVLAILAIRHIDAYYRRILLAGFTANAVVLVLMSAGAILKTFPDYLPIHLARLTDLIPVIILGGMIHFRNRVIRNELETAKSVLQEVSLRNEYATKLNEERRMMVDMLTHELKNPLATIAFASDSVAHTTSRNEIDLERRIQKIQQSVENMNAVIERCSLANSINDGHFPVAAETLNPVHLLQSVIASYSIPQKRIHLRVSSNAPDTIITDRYLLQTIVSNLIENALKYSPEDSIICVDFASTSNAHVTINITNAIDVVMIPDPDLLFKRFYRHPLAHKTSGSGLGLFLVREICITMGGGISFETTPDSITFSIELPV